MAKKKKLKFANVEVISIEGAEGINGLHGRVPRHEGNTQCDQSLHLILSKQTQMPCHHCTPIMPYYIHMIKQTTHIEKTE